MKKIISILLIATFLVGMITVPSFATDGDVIYSQDFENTTVNELPISGPKPSTAYTGGDAFRPSIVTWEGDKALKIDHENTTWGCYTLVPASDLAGVTKYTIEFTMQQDETAGRPNSLFGIRIGTFDSTTAVGDWINMRGKNNWRLDHYNTSNGYESLGYSMFNPGSKSQIKIEVDTELQILRFYIDGTLKFSANGIYSEVGGIYLLSSQTMTWIDDFKVTEGVSAYATEDDSNLPQRPDADYTGKQAGEVIFSENFDNAQTTDDFYWRRLNNACFMSGVIDVAIDTKINGSQCAKIIAGEYSWGAYEVVPAKALENYDVYTVHLTVNAKSHERFSLFYNTPDEDKTSNCGLLEMRWDPMQIRNQGIINGTSNAYSDDATSISNGTTFQIAIQIDYINGVTTVYLNGEYFSANFGINKDKSALYLVGQNCEVYLDDLMVTAGTYVDYAGDMSQDDNNDDNSQTTTQDTTETTAAPAATTDVSNENTANGGCGSVATFGGVAILMTLGSAYMIVDNKKRAEK